MTVAEFDRTWNKGFVSGFEMAVQMMRDKTKFSPNGTVTEAEFNTVIDDILVIDRFARRNEQENDDDTIEY